MKRGKRLSFGDIQRLIRDREGGVAVMTAVTMTSLLGAAGLGTEATLWYVAERNQQGATDAAAFTAATAEAAGQSSTAFKAAATAVAKQYGFTASCTQSGSQSFGVCINNPPASGPNTGNSQAIEVIISEKQPLMFASLFLSSQPTISARAVAAPSAATGGTGAANCIIALDKGKVTDVNDTGNSTLNMQQCNLQINSTSADALNMSGSVTINAKTVSIVGNYETSGSATLNASGGVTTGGSAMADPYANVSIPALWRLQPDRAPRRRGEVDLGDARHPLCLLQWTQRLGHGQPCAGAGGLHHQCRQLRRLGHARP